MRRPRPGRPRAIPPVIAACAIGLLLWACGAPPEDGSGYTCSAPPADLAACMVDADCATVVIGCYCGAQPVDGVARIYAASAQACEDTAESTCMLGCPTELRQIAQDGNKTDPGAPIGVRCDRTGGAAGTCTSYVP